MRPPISPHDTLLAATLRFVLELAALFAIGAAFGIWNFLISAVAIGVFNAKDDKRFRGIQVSGVMRLIIEIFIALIGIYGTLLVLGPLPAGIFAMVWIMYLYLGRARLLWLARGEQKKTGV